MSDLPLTPREIVEQLDRYVIGQAAAKRAVAIALRNRYRRQQVSGEIREEIAPNNILMIGPTGVGKTEIARRLARLADAPFLKVEASKFTEVGYVGRDVESMVRDLVELSIAMVRSSHAAEVQPRAAELAEERIVDLLLPPVLNRASEGEPAQEQAERRERTREKLRAQLEAGQLEDRSIEADIGQRGMQPVSIFSHMGVEELDLQFSEAFESMFPKRKKRRRMKVREARKALIQEETDKLLDMDQVVAQGIEKVESCGIIFIDEIDKIAGGGQGSGPDVSREGVQRDLLPIIEGANVSTKYGMVKTDHLLFIAAGAFHQSDPSDLIPELQGRFPIRVELTPLSEDDFVRILTEPRNALLKQYRALLAAEGVEVTFREGAVRRIAAIAAQVNEAAENIGARRLHTVMTTLLEDLLFDVPDTTVGRVEIDEERVDKRLGPILGDRDLSRFIL